MCVDLFDFHTTVPSNCFKQSGGSGGIVEGLAGGIDSAAFALVTGIIGERDVSSLGHFARVNSSRLLFDSAEGMANNKGRVSFPSLHIRRNKQIGGHADKLIGKSYPRRLNGITCAHNGLFSDVDWTPHIPSEYRLEFALCGCCKNRFRFEKRLDAIGAIFTTNAGELETSPGRLIIVCHGVDDDASGLDL